MRLSTRLTRAWSRFVAAHLVADDPMDDERRRWQAKRSATWGEVLDGRPPPRD